jgi:hypothetical protein
MTHNTESRQPRNPSAPVPVPFESETLEQRVAQWRRWVADEQACPESALDAELVKLLEQIRHSL